MKFISKPTLKKKYESAEQSDPNFSNYYKNSPFSRETDPGKVTSKLKNSLVANNNSIFNPLTNYLKYGEISNTLVYPDPNNNMEITSGFLGIKYLREFFSHSGVGFPRSLIAALVTVPVAFLVDLAYNVPDFIRGSIDSLAQFIQEKTKNTNVVFEALGGLISATLLLANTPLRILVGLERLIGNLSTFPIYVAGFGYDKALEATDIIESTQKNLKWVMNGFVSSVRLAIGSAEPALNQTQQLKPRDATKEQVKPDVDQSSVLDNNAQSKGISFTNLEQTTPEYTKNIQLENSAKSLEQQEGKQDRSIKPKSKQ